VEHDLLFAQFKVLHLSLPGWPDTRSARTGSLGLQAFE